MSAASDSTTLNIVDLIEKNPITKLSQTYNTVLLTKLQENFTTFEQQLFVSSFYCYLNYDKNIDFVVDLDDVWRWLGFTQKAHAKTMIESNFKINVDYKNVLSSEIDEEQEVHSPDKSGSDKQKKHGGHNKQPIKLTIRCFKLLCLKAQTKKAGEIHEYYMKMEEVLHQVLDDETSELRRQLEQQNTIISTLTVTSNTLKQEKRRAVEKTLITQFPVNTECVYFGTIDNTNTDNEKLIKFGHTNNLGTRVADHHKKYVNFILVAAFRVQNKVEIENLIKTHPKIKRHIRTIEVSGKNKTEIIAYDSTNFTIERLTKHITDIIHSRIYNIDNFNRILKRNEELESAHTVLTAEIESKDKIITKQTLELNELRAISDKQKQDLEIVAKDHQSVYQNELLTDDETTQKITEFVNTMCIVRPDVEECSVHLEGRFRLWHQQKPTKEMFHALKNYMDIRFKAKRINHIHGYQGIKLKEVEYKKTLTPQNELYNVETFLFERCKFSDNGKILNSVLLQEYQNWKTSVNFDIQTNDMKDIKAYLNASPHALKATVFTESGTNEGYYGLSMRENYYQKNNNMAVNITTGKKVEKREVQTNNLLGVWDTIVKAASSECISAAKMSRCVKNKTVIGDYYYCLP